MCLCAFVIVGGVAVTVTVAHSLIFILWFEIFFGSVFISARKRMRPMIFELIWLGKIRNTHTYESLNIKKTCIQKIQIAMREIESERERQRIKMEIIKRNVGIYSTDKSIFLSSVSSLKLDFSLIRR